MSTAFELADQFVDEAAALDPLLATQLGIPGRDGEWADTLGMEGIESYRRLCERYEPLVADHLDDSDPRQRLAARVMKSAFEENRVSFEELDHFRTLRHLASPFHMIRLVFDVMDASTPEGRAAIAQRLHTLEKPLSDYRDLLARGVDAGIVVPKRQVRSVIDQARRLAGQPSSIDEIVARGGGDREGGLMEAAADARAAYAGFADWLERHYLPEASDDDGAGREAYLRAADRLVGKTIDPDEAYRWGWDEFHRLRSEMERVADEIEPGEDTEAVKEFLETDPGETAAGTDELIRFVERTLAEAVDDLSGKHFDVPDEIRPLTVQLAPAGSPLGVYYRRPSEDFSRPGGVWYSIGDQEVFPLYQHVSTAYHEGFPGHHLQIATAMHRREAISRFQSLLTFYPGYGEGWGMYAEVLMGELGYLDDPRHYFGMLAKQMYRAARVVVDIGLHLGLNIDESSPMAAGEPWTFPTATRFMEVYGFRTPAQARDEVLRYLGWPGQAIAYKLGEREILEIRDETRRRLGVGFDLRSFHATVIDNGSMRLDLLRDVVAERLAG